MSFSTAREAHDAGIDTVYQDLALAPDLSVPESIFLGHEVMAGGLRGRLGVLGRRQMARDADEALRLLGIVLPSVERQRSRRSRAASGRRSRSPAP